jgi:hypothetical protein
MKTQKFLGDGGDNALEEIHQAIGEVLEEWGWR